MPNAKMIAKNSLNPIFVFGVTMQMSQNTMSAHKVSPAYVDIKLGNCTTSDRESRPATIVTNAKQE